MTATTLILSLLASASVVIPPTWLPGCGGSRETAAAETSAAKARFVKRGEAICKAADARQRKLAARFSKQNPITEPAELVIPVVVPAIERELRRLEALHLPSGDKATIERIFDEMKKGIEDAKYDPVDPVYIGTDPFRKARRLAVRYGLQVCAYSSQAVVKHQRSAGIS